MTSLARKLDKVIILIMIFYYINILLRNYHFLWISRHLFWIFHLILRSNNGSRFGLDCIRNYLLKKFIDLSIY